jgi:Mrp family chromosome partitioning ATPase
MEPIDFVGALRRGWRLLLALAVVGAVVAVLIPAGHSHRVKVALPWKATAIVGSAPNQQGTLLNGGVSSGQIQFFASSQSTQQTVADAANLTVPAFQFPNYMSASIVPAGTIAGYYDAAATSALKRSSPTLVQLTGYAKTAPEAVSLANEYAGQLGYVISDYATKRAASNPKTANIATVATGYTIQQYAEFATKVAPIGTASPVASRKIRLLGGLAVGLVLAAGILLLRELLDKRLRSAARAEANFGFPVVVEIPEAVLATTVSGVAPVPVVDVIRDPDSPGAEAYRMLRMSVMFEALAPLSGPVDPYDYSLEAASSDRGAAPGESSGAGLVETIGRRQVILVVSAAAEPTRPHVAANLAAVYAEAGRRVVVISTGDIESGAGARHGGTLTGDITPEDVQSRLEPSRLEHVSRLHLDHFLANGGQLVTRVPQVLEATRELADAIIVEVPPMLAVHHAEALVHAVDVVLVVGECRFTTFDDARKAGDLLRRLGAPVLGVVLTNVRIDQRDIRQSAFLRPEAAEAEPDDRQEAVALSAGAPSGPTT